MAKITAENPTMLPVDTKPINERVNVSGKNEKLNKVELSFEKTMSDLQNTWSVNATKSKELVPQIPSEYRALFELQQSVYKCHLQTEIITKAGDSIQSTLKKLQNQGG